MLNCFYINGVMWCLILILYEMRWSTVCIPLSPITLLFMLFFILSSFVFGYVYRGIFVFKKATKSNIKSGRIVLCVIAITVVELIYARSIPLLDALIGVKKYGEFNHAIPGLHTLLVTFCSFYSQYIFYHFISNPKEKKLFFYYILLVMCSYGIWFSRMGVFLTVFMSLCIYLSSTLNRIRIKHIILAGVAMIFLMYIFGVLGNIRMGYAYNDNSLIVAFSRMSDCFPKWVPRQFLWAYIYIVAPLANFNYNVQVVNVHMDLMGFFSQWIPDMISSRIFGDTDSFLLSVEDGLSVNIGYGMVYQYAGMVGVAMFVVYLFMLINVFINLIDYKSDLFIPACSVQCALVFFMFFVNTVNYTPIIMCIFYPILLSKLQLKKVGVEFGSNKYKKND